METDQASGRSRKRAYFGWGAMGCAGFLSLVAVLAIIGVIVAPPETEVEPEPTSTPRPAATPRPTVIPESREPQRPVPNIPEETKQVAIATIKGYPATLDAGISQSGKDVILTLEVRTGTDREQARELGDNFVRMVKSFSPDSSPRRSIGTGIYRYEIEVYDSNNERLAFGLKPAGATHITW